MKEQLTNVCVCDSFDVGSAIAGGAVEPPFESAHWQSPHSQLAAFESHLQVDFLNCVELQHELLEFTESTAEQQD